MDTIPSTLALSSLTSIEVNEDYPQINIIFKTI